LGACDDDAIVTMLAAIAERDAADQWTRIAVASSSARRTGKLARELLTGHPAFVADPRPERLQLVQELCELVGSGRDPAEVGGVIDALRDRKVPWQRAALTGLAEGTTRRGTPFPQFLDKLPDRATATL